jgi:hypothetical protein
VRVPPEPEKSFMLLEEFSSQNMGAKSNNLLILHKGLGEWIHLPKSGCIPFKMLEYTLSLHPDINAELNDQIEKLTKIKSVKKMNRLLYKCKDLVMKLDFIPSDHMHAAIKSGLITFGINEKDFS